MLKRIPPYAVGIIALILGWSLLTAGTYLLAGIGFALLLASFPFIGFAFIILRGLVRE